MKLRAAIGVVLAGLAGGAAEAKPASVSIGTWEYRFDDATISKAEVERLLPLRHGILTSFIADQIGNLWLERSHKDFTKWADWGPAWVTKARESVKKRTEGLVAFEAKKYPVELDPVVRHIVDQTRFYLAREQFLLELLVADKAVAPTAPVAGVDVAKRCPAAIDRVLKAANRLARLDAIAYDLSNCLLLTSEFPAEAWQKFLKKYRIAEEQHTEMHRP